MANTLQNLFPFNLNKSKDFTVYPCYVEFSAPVQNGKYIFNVTTTPPVEFGKLLQGQTGVIAGVMIGANCSGDDFTAAIDKPLKLQVLHGGNGTPVNMAPFPFTNFAHGDNFQLQWEPTGTDTKQEESFKLAVTGEVEQLQNMTLNELVLKVSFNFIRVATASFDPVGVLIKDEKTGDYTTVSEGASSILFVGKK